MTCIIETSRLQLRELTHEDLDFLAGMLGDPEVMRHYPAILDRAGAAAWLDRQLHRYATLGFGPWLVERRGSSEPLGQIGLLQQQLEGEESPSIEVAYLLRREAWGYGYATEGARACRDHAFHILRVPRVISLIRPENVASRRVAERNGFVVFRQTLHAGLLHDVWGMTRETWDALERDEFEIA